MPLLSTCLLYRYLFHDKIPFCLFLLYASTSLPSSMACIPTIYYFFWVKYHPNKVYSQKKSRQETKYRPHFLPTTKPHPLNPLDCGPTSLVLAGYKLVVLRTLCACSTIFYFCPLSFPRRFCRSIFALFRSAMCFCLISSCVSCRVFHFLWFGFSFLHVRPVVPCFYSSCFFILVFTPIFLYKRI